METSLDPAKQGAAIKSYSKGSSYAPVRQIAENAEFNDEFETGKVFLETKGSGELITSSIHAII